MSKKVITRVLSCIMAICLLVSGGAISAFAMGTDDSVATANVTPRAGVEDIPYGGEEHYMGVMNGISTNITPVKTAGPDSPSTHRMILRVNFAKSARDFFDGVIADNNGHPIKVNVYVIRSNGEEECITDDLGSSNVADLYYAYRDFRTEWFSVYPGEKIQFKFDIVSQGNPTGHLRYADVQYWAYCD